MSFVINSHESSKRVKVIKLNQQDLDRLIFPFKKHSITSLEYKPFSRFSLANSLNEAFEKKLGSELIKILNDRETGTVIVEPEVDNKKFDKDFLVKLSTGLAHLVGTPNFDSAAARRYGNNFRLLHDDTHVSLFTEDSMHRLLRDCGFKIAKVEYPFFETKFFNKADILKVLDTDILSPPMHGSVMTFFAKKI